MKSNLVKKEDLWSKLKALRGYTVDLGFLHQSQVDQLKLWGRLAFQGVPASGVEIVIDFTLKDVKYNLKGGKLDKDIPKQATLVAGLDRSVSDMLGEEWRLLIDFDGKNIYTGRRRISAPVKTNERKPARSTRKSRRRTRR